MKKAILLILTALILSLSIHAQDEIKFSLKNGTDEEKQTQEQMQRLLKTYDLSKWIFTKEIVVDEKAIPHSHPVLTLSTRHLKDDELLVSTFIHEQSHRFLSDVKDKETDVAVEELKKMFPKVPTGFPEGARDERSTYGHIFVIYLEYRGIREVFGELKAKQIMDFWATDHYTWVYKTVLERTRDIGQLMFKHKLIPPTPKKSPTDKNENKISKNTRETESKQYFIVLYTLGENWDSAKQPNEQTFFKEHSTHLAKLRKEKTINTGGRYSDTGMLLIKAKDKTEAENLINEDTAVKNKLFSVKIFPFSPFYQGSIE